ncbi:hypothetical protein BKA93DRAFT_314087 [Sparassis latifolia]
MESHYKPKVTSKLEYDRVRPVSPSKLQQPQLGPSPSLPIARPKAKVTSSATVISRRTNSSTRPPSALPSPRAPSPFKQDHAPHASVVFPVKARLTTNVRANGIRSASPGTDSRQQALTIVSTETQPRRKARNGSISSHVSHIPSPAHSTAPSPSHSPTSSRVGVSSEENGSPHAGVTLGVVRVKSKISRLTEPGLPSSPSSPPLAHRSARPASASNISLSPPLPPANGYSGTPSHAHQRFATTRESASQRVHAFQPFPANDDLVVKYGGYTVPTKLDPAEIPLPPQSPPMSTLSFSSRSSASRSSVSCETQATDTSRNTAPASALKEPTCGAVSTSSQAVFLAAAASTPSPSEGGFDDDDVDDHVPAANSEDIDPDRKMKAEAKSNRKIADLEITTRSLLAINLSLEATKHRQAKEIRDLKRKLRESRLILPPPAYHAVKSSLTHDDTAEDDVETGTDAGSEDEDEQALLEGHDDEPYRRVKVILDSLLDECARALASTPADFAEGGRSGAKVLSADEVRSWRGDDTETRSLADRSALGEPSLPSRIAVPDSDDDMGSESEVEASLLESDSRATSPLPPITVTPSP